MQVENSYIMEGSRSETVQSGENETGPSANARCGLERHLPEQKQGDWKQTDTQKISFGALKREGGKITVRRNISAASYMMRVAQAETPTQVSSVIRSARADLEFVKKCNTEQSDVGKATRIIKRVIAKSRLKISRLKAEANLERQQKQMETVRQKVIAEKLKRKRRARKAQEAAEAGDTEQATVVRTQEINGMSEAELDVLCNDLAASVTLSSQSGTADFVGDTGSLEGGSEALGTTVDVEI